MESKIKNLLSSIGKSVSKILITGDPGVGKTTIIESIYQKSSQKDKIRGFVTKEIRSGGNRVGFGIETFYTKKSGILSHVSDVKSKVKVGNYYVDVDGFEKLVKEELGDDGKIFLIDEIGKMESFSNFFMKKITELMVKDGIVLCSTISKKGEGEIKRLRETKSAQLFEVTKSNRNSIKDDIISSFEKNFDSK